MSFFSRLGSYLLGFSPYGSPVHSNPVGSTTLSHRYCEGRVLLTVSIIPSIPSIVKPVQGAAALHCISPMTSLVVVPDQFFNVKSLMLNGEVSQLPLAPLYDVHCVIANIPLAFLSLKSSKVMLAA